MRGAAGCIAILLAGPPLASGALTGPGPAVVLFGYVEWPLSWLDGSHRCTQRADAVLAVRESLEPSGLERGAAELVLRPHLPGCVDLTLAPYAYGPFGVRPHGETYFLRGSWASGFEGRNLDPSVAYSAIWVGPYGDGKAVGAHGCIPCAFTWPPTVWNGTLRDVATYVPG